MEVASQNQRILVRSINALKRAQVSVVIAARARCIPDLPLTDASLHSVQLRAVHRPHESLTSFSPSSFYRARTKIATAIQIITNTTPARMISDVCGLC